MAKKDKKSKAAEQKARVAAKQTKKAAQKEKKVKSKSRDESDAESVDLEFQLEEYAKQVMRIHFPAYDRCLPVYPGLCRWYCRVALQLNRFDRDRLQTESGNLVRLTTFFSKLNSSRSRNRPAIRPLLVPLLPLSAHPRAVRKSFCLVASIIMELLQPSSTIFLST